MGLNRTKFDKDVFLFLDQGLKSFNQGHGWNLMGICLL